MNSRGIQPIRRRGHPTASLSALLICLFISSCFRYIKLNDQLLEENQVSEIDSKEIQYFISSTILLKRQVRAEEIKNIKGLVVSKTGMYYEKLIIRAKTPCIIEKIEGDLAWVRFEKDSRRMLPFKFKNEGCFLEYLPWLAQSDYIGKIQYGDFTYFLKKGSDAKILAKRYNKVKKKRKRKIIKGIRVNK